MKRSAPINAKGQRDADLRKNFTPQQLEAIGAVTIAWNEAEIFLDIALEQGLCTPAETWLEVAPRMNGYENKTKIIKKLLVTYAAELGQETCKMIESTLDALTQCKGYRDAVAHARAFDVTHGIGELIKWKAKKEQVLLTVPALNGLFERLILLRKELLFAAMIFDALRTLRLFHVPDRSLIEQSIQDHAVRLQDYQTKRRSLPPLPTFPPSLPTPLASEASPAIDHP